MSAQGRPAIPGVKFDLTTCTPANIAALGNLRWQWLRAAALSCIGFGVVVTLAIMCFYLIFTGRSQPKGEKKGHSRFIAMLSGKRTPIALFYVSCMATLSTVAMVSMTQTMYKSSIALGCWNGLTPAGWFFALDLKAQYVFVIANWFADGLLVWRCWVIYRTATRFPVWVPLALPILLYLAIIGFGLFFMIPSGMKFLPPRTFELAYSSLTLSLNVLATSMIVARLLTYRYRLTKAMGKDQGAHYMSYVALVIESAVLVTVFNILLVITMRNKLEIQTVVFQGYIQIQAIAPLLIVVRVLQGKAWSGDTSKATTLPTFRAASGAFRSEETDSTHDVDAVRLPAPSSTRSHFETDEGFELEKKAQHVDKPSE
ncbi:hypothetical protein BKA70DRAFT_224920 [Coprinopsis sp. MPI-PUGE-AT-0042]|nr:hypothetical protein BKA70DRAFT_224920 [Coprinopsis sp. MPI-PUGE-AT-0042]